MSGQHIFNTKNSYTEEFKKKVVQEVLSGQLTKAEANRRYNIGGHSRILTWINIYEKKVGKTEKSSYIETPKIEIMSKTVNADYEQVEQENARLKQELSYASMRVIALETMIHIAETELKINIKKKCSTRPSNQSEKSH